MPNVLTRAVLAASQYVGLLGRPWNGLNLPVRVMWGPTPGARSLLGEQESPDSLPAVVGALSLLCDACTSVSWEVVRHRSVEEGTEVVLPSQLPAARALADWSIGDRWAFLYSALLSGNGVALIERDGRNAPEKIVTYPAPRVAFRLYDDGKLNLLLVPPTMGQAREVPHTACAILRYRPVAYDERIGISPVLLASGTVDLLLATRRMVRATMNNAARPSGYLKTGRHIDQRAAERISERWNTIYGRDGAGGTAVLEEGLEYHTVQLNDLQELAAVETARMGTGDVARLYSIPPALLLGTEQNRSTAQEDRRRLTNFAIQPLSELVADALGLALLSEEQRHQGLGVRLDLGLEMLSTELAEALSKLANSGIANVNELRNRIGLPSAGPAGDQLRAPTNTWPIDSWALGQPASAGNGETQAASITAAQRGLKLISNGWDIER